ncbi:MAG: phosphoethanolamine--lipid A transferase, partial [Thioalkalispiraceae bacterium]
MPSIHEIFARLSNFTAKYPVLVVATFLTLVGNMAFWKALFLYQAPDNPGSLLFWCSAMLLVFTLGYLVISFFRFKYIFRPALVVILVLSAITAYYMDAYGIVIDVQMMHNIAETDRNEVYDLLGSGLFFYLLLLAIIPALFLLRVNIQYRRFGRQLLANGMAIVISLLLVVANFMMFSADYAALFKNHHHVRYLINPSNYVYSSIKYISESLGQQQHDIVAIGLDAHQVRPVSATDKKTILVLVVGETARADNFALNGYQRNTNPLLSKEDIINYPHVSSCGTSTHVSLPCMFSHFQQKDFSESKAAYYEMLPDVLRHAGVEVVWRDNNSGCKGVCKNIPMEDVSHYHLEGICNDRECYDEVLLDQLKEKIETAQNDMVIVLHQKGSHGPAYYLRTPEKLKAFLPECTTNELQKCSQQELVNAYDNTIYYTDYFLSRVVETLKQQQHDTAMVYISDHGESLGENHLYLHSMPYMFAPEQQTHVPLVTWYS